jgi:hypothetical protein
MEPDRKARGREPAESKGHAGMIRDSDPVRVRAAGVPAVKARARAAVAAEDSSRKAGTRGQGSPIKRPDVRGQRSEIGCFLLAF